MLHQISWPVYAVTLICLLVFYYLYTGIVYFRPEIRLIFSRLTAGQQAPFNVTQHGATKIMDQDMMAKAQQDDIEFVSQDEIYFVPDELIPEQQLPVSGTELPSSGLTRSFSEMISEVKTLSRVINESTESKENFEMLFHLIVQKYPELSGTGYQDQINDFLIAEGAPQFPFELTLTELNTYWTN